MFFAVATFWWHLMAHRSLLDANFCRMTESDLRATRKLWRSSDLAVGEGARKINARGVANSLTLNPTAQGGGEHRILGFPSSGPAHNTN